MEVISPEKKNLFIFVLITCLCLAVYAVTLKNSFLLDDYPRVVENNFIRHWSNFSSLFSRSYFLAKEPSYRPVLTFSYMLDYHIWGLNPFGYHLTNLLLHTLNSLLLFIFFSLLLKSRGVSLAAALLFSVHPAASEAVNAIGFRQDLLAPFFSLLALVTYRWLKELKAGSPARWFLYGFSLLSFLLAGFSKENAVILPVLLIFSEWCFPAAPGRKKVKENAPLYSGYFLVLGFYLLVRFAFLHPGPGRDIIGYEAPSLFPRMLTMVRVVVYYLKLMVFPVGLSAEYNFPVAGTFWEIKTAAGGALLAAVLFLAVFSFRRIRALTLGLGWFFIALGPVMNIIPLMNLAAERYLYFPLAGFCLGLAALGTEVSQRSGGFRRLTVTVLVALLAFYSVVTIRRNLDWADSLTFYQKTRERCPGSARVHTNLGRGYLEQGRLPEARAEFKASLELDPGDYYAHNNLGLIYTEQGDYEAAISEYREALAINPFYAKAYNNLGVVYDRTGMYQEAVSEYKKAIVVDPTFARAYNNLGLAYAALGYEQAAFWCYRWAIRLNPLLAEAYNNVAVAYWRLGENAEAWKFIQKARELGYEPDPEFIKLLKEPVQKEREGVK